MPERESEVRIAGSDRQEDILINGIVNRLDTEKIDKQIQILESNRENTQAMLNECLASERALSKATTEAITSERQTLGRQESGFQASLTDLRRSSSIARRALGEYKDKGEAERLQVSLGQIQSRLMNLETERLQAAQSAAVSFIPSGEIFTPELAARILQTVKEERQVLERKLQDVEKAIARHKEASKRRVIKEKQETIESFGLSEAYELFGEGKFYGPERVAQVFGVKVSGEQMPPLPDKAKMEKAKKLGMIMVLRMNVDQQGKGDDTFKPEWKMLLPDILQSGTRDKNYVEQTRAIRDYLKQNELIGKEEYAECADEKLALLSEQIKTNPKAAMETLLALKITQNHRHSEADIRYYSRLTAGVGGSASSVLGENFEATKDMKIVNDGVYVTLVGRFRDGRVGTGLKTEFALKSTQVPGWGEFYAQGVRVVI